MTMDLTLDPRTETRGHHLDLDFPSLWIGTAEYAEGPTGVTVFYFPEKAVGAVDVRGGAPGAYNVDWLKLGYDFPNLDAVTIAGGSWYGLAASAGVAAELKRGGRKSGDWRNLANVAGAIVYDLGDRRLNEIHPDERLGAAALAAARPGRFPLGAQGAGRIVMQGSYFGLWLHSGQGGAFRQIGPTKIATFVVVNAVGAVVDRSGRVVHGGQPLGVPETSIDALLRLVPDHLRTVPGTIMGQRVERPKNPANTTISVVVTNQRLPFSALQRLAVQVHASMGRGIQPFATANDGDVLFAVTTAEIDDPDLQPTDLGTVASELMWDAVLASVPDLQRATSSPAARIDLASCAGTYAFAPNVAVEVAIGSKGVTLTNRSTRLVFGLAPGAALILPLGKGGSFVGPGPFLLGGRFEAGRRNVGPAVVLNPGPWEQRGFRTRPPA
ncbi:MAG: peptidase S58 DmpA [Alphaproteobacteria bacterium]|nr:peptidase S58 DmpA [Alphaproteobacteria bacterium]